jgi:Ca-activated chloride channel family protein
MATEGIVDDDTLLSTLKQEAPAAARIFPFGVGYDVNTLFLDQLAADHRGLPAYVAPEERIDEKISAFYGRIQSPVLTNIALDFGSVQTYDIYPNPLPDLYAGTQLIVTGRYNGSGAQTITLTGEVEGQRETYTYAGNFSASTGKDFIPRLWASRKIGYLLTQIRLNGEKEEWISAVVSLSLRYGIITPYTSFLVEEPVDVLTVEGRERAAEELTENFQAVPMAPSGEKAVEDAVMRQELEAADAAPTAGGAMPGADGGQTASNSVRYVGDKTFLCQDNVCTDTAYVPDKMTPQTITFMSETYWQLTETHPELSAYFAVAEESFFVAQDGTAYHFRIGTEADAVTRPESSSATPSSPTSPTTATPQTETGTIPTATSTPSSSNSSPGTCGGAFALLGLAVGVVFYGKTRTRIEDAKDEIKG